MHGLEPVGEAASCDAAAAGTAAGAKLPGPLAPVARRPRATLQLRSSCRREAVAPGTPRAKLPRAPLQPRISRGRGREEARPAGSDGRSGLVRRCCHGYPVAVGARPPGPLSRGGCTRDPTFSGLLRESGRSRGALVSAPWEGRSAPPGPRAGFHSRRGSRGGRLSVALPRLGARARAVRTCAYRGLARRRTRQGGRRPAA
jgi:hypothetical protein